MFARFIWAYTIGGVAGTGDGGSITVGTGGAQAGVGNGVGQGGVTSIVLGGAHCPGSVSSNGQALY